MKREQALELLYAHMQSVNLRRHCLAVEAVMRALAKRFSEDEEKSSDAARAMEDKWGVVGLLHDGDYEETKTEPNEHTLRMAEWLKQAGVEDEEILGAILSHNFSHTGQNSPKNKLEWSLYAADELTGFIVAVALVRPDKKLASVTVESVMKKWPEKAFAAGVHREQIEACEEKLGIPLREFVGIALEAMQGISGELGL